MAKRKICNVLVVEDHAGIRTVLADALKTEGYDFTLMDSAGDVGGVLDRGGHDVVVIDLPLEHGDGFALADAAREAGVGVVLTSGDQRLTPRVERSGHRHIRKPFMLEQLLPLIDDVLRELAARCVRRRAAPDAPRRAARR